MNILLINHYAGSPQLGMEFRPYYMARELQRLGSNGHQYVLKNHTYSVLANKFINVMEDIRKTR